jgi:membrane-associated phospholipid phosphatase
VAEVARYGPRVRRVLERLDEWPPVQRLTAAWWPWLEPDVASRLVARAMLLIVLGSVVGLLLVLVDGRTYDVDGHIIDGITDDRRDGVVEALDAIGGVAGFTLVLVVGVLVAGASRLRAGTWHVGQLLVVAVGGVLFIVGVIKVVVPRARPEVALFDAFSSAFPSGHSARAAVSLGVAAWLLSRRRRRVGGGVVWAVAAVVVAFVGASRIYLGMHWPTDVVAGLVIGAAWLAVVLPVAEERRLAHTGTTRNSRNRAAGG